ncbi:prolyl oligopeptidase family protein [Microbacterium maritypicum]|uniref:prolyl oligopeptidase family serine peptidase n=1 Tax=Microbacterium TaxID=33882 RepID=UPI003803A92F
MNSENTADGVPATRLADVVEILHGRAVSDPYRWLEEPDSAETAAWVRSQNDFTESQLSALPERQWFQRVLSDVLSAPRSGAPRKAGGRYLVSRNDGAQNQDVWWQGATLHELATGGGSVLLDPNRWSDDGTTAVLDVEVSKDGRTLAAVVSEGGSDWSEYRLFDVETGDPVADDAIQSKGMPPAWLPDSASYVYAAPVRDATMTGTETGATGRWRLLHHRVGTPESSDRVLLDHPEEPGALYLYSVSHDGRWLVVDLRIGTALSNRLWVFPLETQEDRTSVGEPLRVIDEDEAAFDFVRMVGERLLCRTDLHAERGRIVSIDLASFRQTGVADVTEVIPAGEGTLTFALAAGDELLLVRLSNAVPRIERYSLAGERRGVVDAPAGEPIEGRWWASPDDEEYFVAWTTPTRPSFALRATTGTNRLEPIPGLSVSSGADGAEDADITQAWATSKDGTRVPYFVVRPAGQEDVGPRPTMLWGYGGFGVVIGTDYYPALAGWLAAGGTVAIANLRGGGEFGREWYDGGRRAHKQNVFDDYIAVGEHLLATGVTGPDQLVLHGASNGGLLVGAVITQRPDLAAVALPNVGVMDLLRFHLFTFGAAWISDYGDPDELEDFEIAIAYSPVHNVKPAAYPATMVTTGDHDDRVVPLHSYKFAAALQRAQRGEAPILARIETNSGHGAGKGRTKLIAELADMLAFAARHSGLDVLGRDKASGASA